MSVDPLADAPANIGWSPYAYVWNNPISNIDPDGRHGESVTDEYERTWNNDTNDWDYKRISGLGGDAFDVVHTTTGSFAGQDLKTTTDVIFNETGGTQRFTDEVPGAWIPPIQDAALQSFDFSDFIPTKGAAKGVATAGFGMFFKMLGKKAAKEGIEAANGLVVKGFTKHGVNRAIGSYGRKGVSPLQMLDAIKNPLKVGDVITDNLGRQSQRFIGQWGTVAVNPKTGLIISVNPTSTKRAAKLMRQ